MHQAVCDLAQLVSQSRKWWQMLRWMRSMDHQRSCASDCSSSCAPSQDVVHSYTAQSACQASSQHVSDCPLCSDSQVLPSFQYVTGLPHSDAEPGQPL